MQAYKFTHTHALDKTMGIAGSSETTPAHFSKSRRSLFTPIELGQQTISGSTPTFSARTCAILLLKVKPWLCFLNLPPLPPLFLLLVPRVAKPWAPESVRREGINITESLLA